MGSENLNPLAELKSLERKIDVAADLGALKSIFFRLEEIAKENANDFDVQLAVGDLKQHLVNRGTKLKEMKEPKAPVPPPPPPQPPSIGPAAGPPSIYPAMPEPGIPESLQGARGFWVANSASLGVAGIGLFFYFRSVSRRFGTR